MAAFNYGRISLGIVDDVVVAAKQCCPKRRLGPERPGRVLDQIALITSAGGYATDTGINGQRLLAIEQPGAAHDENAWALLALLLRADPLCLNQGCDYLDIPCARNHVCIRRLASSKSDLVIRCRRESKRSSSPPI